MIKTIYDEIGESKSPETARKGSFRGCFRNRSSKIRIETAAINMRFPDIGSFRNRSSKIRIETCI